MSTNYPQGPQGLPEPPNPFVQPQPPKKRTGLKIAGGIVGGFVALAVLGSCVSAMGGGSPEAANPPAVVQTQEPEPTQKAEEPSAKPTEVEKTEEPAEPAEPVAEEGSSLPKDEQEFVDIVQTGIDAADDAENDLQAGRALTKRDKALKKGDFDSVKNWRGTVKTLDSNGDGHGVLTIELAPNIAVGTWNNAFSDMDANTLIKSDKMMETLAEMSEGDEIVFSGRFIVEQGVPENKGLTKIGKVQDPEFVFKFSSVKAG